MHGVPCWSGRAFVSVLGVVYGHGGVGPGSGSADRLAIRAEGALLALGKRLEFGSMELCQLGRGETLLECKEERSYRTGVGGLAQ